MAYEEIANCRMQIADLFERGEYSSGIELEYLLNESRELLAILTASVKTANSRRQRPD